MTTDTRQAGEPLANDEYEEWSFLTWINNRPSPRCSCFDEDCKKVVSPFSCWIGDEVTGAADGYCPLMYGADQ